MSTNSPTKIFVNLPVKDLPRSKEFSPNSASTSTRSSPTTLGVHGVRIRHVLTYPKFKPFAPNAIADANKSTEVLVALSCENRGRVDELVAKTVAAGGHTCNHRTTGSCTA